MRHRAGGRLGRIHDGDVRRGYPVQQGLEQRVVGAAEQSTSASRNPSEKASPR